MTRYEKCAHCWHFIEVNDAESIPGFPVAEYVHLDNGGKEHDHDASPSGDIRTLDEWKAAHPELFRKLPDGNTGPNSVMFAPSPCPRCYGEREWSGKPGAARCYFCGQES